MIGIKRWVAVVAAAVALAFAALVSSVAPASECSTGHDIHWWIAAPFFALFLAAGAYVVAAGNVAQRLTLFLASGLLMSSYVAVLAASLPMVYETEIGCARHPNAVY
jgi:cytochrome bd-type quinol oxidase subunit 2